MIGERGTKCSRKMRAIYSIDLKRLSYKLKERDINFNTSSRKTMRQMNKSFTDGEYSDYIHGDNYEPLI